mgnify:FL=1
MANHKIRRAIALMVLFGFGVSCMLSGCGNNAMQTAKEHVWNNAEYIEGPYDVIVMGTEPEGIAAAVSAARNGLKTLLLGQSVN